MCGGRLDLIHMMFCQIAEHNGKPPIPPQSMLLLLELTPEDCKEHPVIVSDVALEKAFAKMIKPEDNADVFYTKVISVVEQQVARSKHATVEIEKLRPAFKELHEACGGSSKALFAFFMELLPEEQRGQYSLPMWVSMVMKLPPQTTHIELDHFTDCFAQAMDSTDTAESILPKVRKHIELNQDPKAAAAKAAEIDRQAKEIAEREKAAQAHAQSGPSAEAVELVNKFATNIKELHSATEGRVSLIHAAFCSVAESNGKPRIPPQAMGSLLELTKEDTMKNPVTASLEQLTKAFAKLVRPEETVENFQSKVVEVVDKCTRRAQHASKQISILSPALTKLHEACEGSSKSLFEFFMDLVPEAQRPGLTQEQWNSLIMKVHPKTEKIPLDVFILSFQDSMDDSDDSSKILPVLEKHIEMLNSGGAARGKTSQEEEATNSSEDMGGAAEKAESRGEGQTVGEGNEGESQPGGELGE
uniref:Uncharacterized protein n=1 Tax=Guillardia theta TaxID=55529 RepID=A0A6U6BCV3_GUITH